MPSYLSSTAPPSRMGAEKHSECHSERVEDSAARSTSLLVLVRSSREIWDSFTRSRSAS